jgi:hypothetical protein
VTAANRARAASVAKRLLAAAVLPAGAREIAQAPKTGGNLLAGPLLPFLVASQVDRHRFWMLSPSTASAVTKIEAHLPSGAERIGEGSSGSELFATYALPLIASSAISAERMAVSIVGLPHGGAVARVDAEVRYIAPRPSSQRVPAQARLVDITVGSNLAHPLLARTVTNPANVRRIRQIVDSLPFLRDPPGAVYSCPSFSLNFPRDSFVIRPTPLGPALAKVTEIVSTASTDDPCIGTSLTVNGHHEPTLQDGGILLKQAGRLLEARLGR